MLCFILYLVDRFKITMKIASHHLVNTSLSIVRKFFQFLKNPRPHVSANSSIRQNIIQVLVLVATTYGFALLIGLLSWALITMGFYEEVQHFMYDQLKAIFAKEVWRESDWTTVAFTIISAIWIAPFHEEVTFRLFLRYRLRNLIISLSLQAIFFLSLMHGSFNDSLPGFLFVLLIITLSVSAFWVMRQARYQACLLRWWDRWFPFIFYYSAMAFGLIHYVAYGLEGHALWFAPVILAPHFLMGLMLGFVRIQYGMWYAIGGTRADQYCFGDDHAVHAINIL